jgi:DNA-binding LacI/PurR family transcriptional regulator
VLKAQIDAGAWKAFEILPPVRALAQTHRASVCAVRLALEQLVGEGLVARNARRRRMFLTSTQGYAMDGRGIVLEVHSDPLDVRESGSVFMEVQRGILAGCGDGLAPLLIAHAHELQAAQPDGFLDLPLKGILLYGRFTRKNLRAYERLTVPVCNVDSPPEGLRLHSVSVENQSAAYDAAQRLMALGHRRIAFVQFILYTLRDIDPDSKERRDGYLRACKEAGIAGAINTIFSFLPGRDVQHSLRALLKARPRFTAAVCVDPTGADALAQEAERAGLKLPRDLGIVCFQGAAEKVRFSGPATDFFTLGRRAVRLLDRPRLPPIYERVATSWREQGSVVPAH